MRVPSCTLCNLVTTAEAERDTPIPPYIQMSCKSHYTYMFVATEHDVEFDAEDEGDRQGIEEAIRFFYDNGRLDSGKTISVLLRLGTFHATGSGAGHVRLHVSSISPYKEMPQQLANEIAEEAEEVVHYYHPDIYPDFQYDALWTMREISDEEVEERVQGFQYAMDREIARLLAFKYDGWSWRFDPDWREKHHEWVSAYYDEIDNGDLLAVSEQKHVLRYDLEDLPFHLQRALVTHWEHIWDTWADRYLPTPLPRPGDSIVIRWEKN